MLQRKQTLYLLATIALCILSAFLPWAYLATNNKVNEKAELIKVTTTYNAISSLSIAAVLVLSAISIFLYKKRSTQKNIVLLTILLVLAHIGALLTTFKNWQQIPAWSFGLVLPLLYLVLNFLAYRGIVADEKLVKSMDRFRD